MNQISELIKTALCGQRCWSVVIGPGSLLSLDFGQKFLRNKPLSNPALTEEQRAFFGECELYICCAWRLQSPENIICSSTSDSLDASEYAVTLRGLSSLKVVDVTVCAPGMDCWIVFEGGLTLALFSDQTNVIDDGLNFVLSVPGAEITVGLFSKVVVTSKANQGLSPSRRGSES